MTSDNKGTHSEIVDKTIRALENLRHAVEGALDQEVECRALLGVLEKIKELSMPPKREYQYAFLHHYPVLPVLAPTPIEALYGAVEACTDMSLDYRPDMGIGMVVFCCLHQDVALRVVKYLDLSVPPPVHDYLDAALQVHMDKGDTLKMSDFPGWEDSGPDVPFDVMAASLMQRALEVFGAYVMPVSMEPKHKWEDSWKNWYLENGRKVPISLVTKLTEEPAETAARKFNSRDVQRTTDLEESDPVCPVCDGREIIDCECIDKEFFCSGGKCIEGELACPGCQDVLNVSN